MKNFVETAQKSFEPSSPIFLAVLDIDSDYRNLKTMINRVGLIDTNQISSDVYSAFENGEEDFIQQIVEIDTSIVQENVNPLLSEAYFLAAYNCLEYSLNFLCSAWQKQESTKLKFKDISGQGIPRAILYLEKVVGLNKIKNSEEWQQLTHWNTVRNCLVHNSGILRNDKDKQSVNYLGIKTKHPFSLFQESEQEKILLGIEASIAIFDLSNTFLIKCIEKNT